MVKYLKKGLIDLVDILVACYNGENFLNEQLNSLVNQTCKDINIIIRDDGSTDNTPEILKHFKEKYPERITLIEGKPSKSAKNNFFELMEYAKSDYIMFCDQDDVWNPDKVELTLKKMKTAENSSENNTPILCHTDLSVADKNLNIIHNSFFKMQKFDITKTSLNRALVQNIITGCTTMINKPLLNLAKGTNSHSIIMHDWWLFLIASAFGKVEVINSPTILYRQHGNNQLGATDPSKVSYYTNKLKTGSTLYLTYAQAECFFSSFEHKLTETQKALVKEYVSFPQKSKLQKISSTIKNDFWKHSAIKKAGQIILI